MIRDKKSIVSANRRSDCRPIKSRRPTNAFLGFHQPRDREQTQVAQLPSQPGLEGDISILPRQTMPRPWQPPQGLGQAREGWSCQQGIVALTLAFWKKNSQKTFDVENLILCYLRITQFVFTQTYVVLWTWKLHQRKNTCHQGWKVQWWHSFPLGGAPGRHSCGRSPPEPRRQSGTEKRQRWNPSPCSGQSWKPIHAKVSGRKRSRGSFLSKNPWFILFTDKI